MRGKRILVLGVLLTMGLLLPAAPALANGEPPPPTGDGLVIWNENHTVEEGESVEGDLLYRVVLVPDDESVPGGGG